MTTKMTRIEATGKPLAPARLSIEAAAPVELKAAEGEGKRPTFDILGYTGAVMNVEGFFSPVVVDLNGLKAASGQIPALLNHDTDRIVGQTDSVAIDADGVRLTGTITGDDGDAATVVNHSKNGFKWRASIGASIVRREFLEAGKKDTVNGREVTGPIVIAREAQLLEISFVAIPADSQTSADIAASHPPASLKGETTMNFDQWIVAQGFDPAAITDTQRTSLKAMYDAEQVKAKAETKTGSTQSLDQIVAARRNEDARVAEITRIAGEAINDRPPLVSEFELRAKTAIEKNKTVQEFELEIMRIRAEEPARGPYTRSNSSDTRAGAKMIEAALCLGGGLRNPEKHFDDQTLNAASDRFPHGLGLHDLLTIAARENGRGGHTRGDIKGLLRDAFGTDIRAQGWSTLSLPGIFTNTANKFLVSGFDAVESSWREIAARRSVRDFKATTSYSLTGGFKYEKVGPGGELKHATVGEISYTNQAETYGKMFAITRTDLINDDLGALTQVPQRLGRGAALALNDVFWAEFLDNGSFFTTGNANYFEGAATNLQISSLTTAETTFYNQTDPDGNPTAISPAILLVPNALNVIASTIINSTQIAGDTTANTITFMSNPHAGKFRVVRSSYLSNPSFTGYSTTAWYLLADPADLAVIEVVFLNGRETPVVESADADFNSLGIQFRGYHDFGCSLQEKRAGVKAKGIA